jgi:hypothetical protein
VGGRRGRDYRLIDMVLACLFSLLCCRPFSLFTLWSAFGLTTLLRPHFGDALSHAQRFAQIGPSRACKRPPSSGLTISPL